MLLKRNLLENLTILSCSGTIICVFLHCVSNISPISGVWFLSYTVVLFILSVFCSFKFIQWLLHLNKPIKYDIDNLTKKYPILSVLSDVLPQVNKKREKVQSKEYDTNELSVITTVLEKKLVSSWYVPYISEEIGFPFACKQMLDQMIAKAFQICNKIETKDIYVDVCAIVTSHLKEYKKAIKRHETSPNKPVESHYKKSHSISDNKNKKSVSTDHCTNVLRIILKELVPWELWDTPYSELLVRILALKLDNFFENTITNPDWLNDRLLTILKEQEKIEIDTEKIEQEMSKEVVQLDESQSKEETSTPVAKKEISVENKEVLKPITEEIQQECKPNKQENEEVQGSEPVEIKPAAILRQKRGRQGRNEVKIYDRIIEGSVKTWETDMDLQCISVGQDLLASLDEMTLSRLWGHEETEHSPNMRAASPQPLWFGEEDAIDIEQEVPKEAKKESSPKPADMLLKDLQSTVHQAKTKIGDLQVPYSIDVPRNHTSDEAAGMMEGLFDKGIAGIKKGLRFTGLSDDSMEKSPAHKASVPGTGGGERISPSELYKSRPKPELVSEAKEAYVAPPPLLKEENGIPAPTLVKQQRVTSQDSVARGGAVVGGQWSPPLSGAESPEPQYEEAADLSASIAKLRSLLHHTAPREGEVWWEGAEETRGRAARRPSSKPVDAAALADEYDMSMDRNTPEQASNNMQRLDRLFQRTVTGVFNSIKTAVGAEGEALPPRPPRDWTYVCTSPELSAGAAVSRLVGARRSLGRVDAALDSLRQLPAPPAQPPAPAPLDLEEWVCNEGARWGGGVEVACAGGAVDSHLAFRLATVLCADIAESLICSWLEDLSEWLRQQVFQYFEQLAASAPVVADRQLRPFDIDETCRAVMEKIPEATMYVLSEQTLSQSVRLVLSSLSHRAVNRDVVFRLLDAFVVHFHRSAGLRNPSFDSN